MPRRAQVLAPSLLHKRLGLHRAAVTTDQQPGPFERGAQRQDRARVSIGRVRFNQPVVPVVPDGRQAQPAHRREGCRPRAHHHTSPSQQQRDEGPVTARRPVLGREHHDRLVAQLHTKSARQVLGLLSSRHDDNRPSSAR